MTPTRATHVLLEPGDATRYEFVVIVVNGEYHVIKIDGAPMPEQVFYLGQIEQFEKEAADVLHYTYDSYSGLVGQHEWIDSVVFPAAVEAKVNPWTYLAAFIAAVRVRRTR